MKHHIEELEKWVTKTGTFSGNFTRSEKTKELKEFLLRMTSFLDDSVGFAVRYGYIKNGILSANKCNHCGKDITRFGFDAKYCCQKCGLHSTERKEKISIKKKERDASSPHKEMTLKWWVWKYGKEDGTRRYNQRGERVAITEDSLILKYGKEEGSDRWQEYKNKISESQTLKYNIERYGEKDGKERFDRRNEYRRMTLKNFIRCYGEKVGTEKYLEHNNKFKSGYSAISQELFWTIHKKLKNRDKIYFGELNKEFNKNDFDRGYYYDFVCTKRKKVIEFNGDMWHANPAVYTESDVVNPHKNDTAKQIWERDRIKIDFIKTFGYDVLVIWESEYIKNKESTIMKCLNFLGNNKQ